MMESMNVGMVGIAGDWHGNKGWVRLRLTDFANAGITKILQLGDFGFWPGNHGRKWLHRVNKIATEFGQTIYVTLGNHEDYTQIAKLVEHPTEAGWLHNPLYPSILVAPRGHRWEWDGVSFVSLGGGNSIDRPWRTEGVSWWKEEQITLDDVYKTVSGGYADVMLAHDCPAGVPLFGGHKTAAGDWPYDAFAYAQKSRDMMRQAVDGVKPKLFLHGHYHFLAEHDTFMHDGVSEYELHSVGLACDGMQNNIAIMSLPDMEMALIRYFV